MKFNKLLSIKRSKQYRKRILEISRKVSAIHLGGSFSCTEIMEVIFNYFLKSKKEKECFVMSKGHSSIIQYIILEEKNILKKKQVEMYCKKGGILGVHPDRGNPGINASTGSLGHGLGMVAGLALAEKRNRNTIYSVLSDGELQEGSTWEAIMLIPALKLNNVVVVVDNNNLQSFEKTSVSHPGLYPIEKKFREFGWDSQKCDGHNAKEIYEKIKYRDKSKPYALIAKTIKGYPVSYMMNVPIWHYRSPNKNEYLTALKEIDEKSF
tara:strand:+ start:873 stop:1670 length:798 start_codon:yes stop_codon:yes gene_type:complete